MKKNFVFILFVSFSLTIASFNVAKANENQAIIDSLHLLLNNSKDHQRVDLLVRLSELYKGDDNEVSMHMAQVASDLSKELDYPEGGALSFFYLGSQYHNSLSLDTAIKAYEKSLHYYERLNQVDNISMVLNQLGMVYMELGDYSVALDYLVKGLLLMEEKGVDQGIGSSYMNIGVVMQRLKEYEQSLEYFNKALSFLTTENDYSLKGEALMHIGELYYEMGNYIESENYYQQALVSIKMSGNKANEVKLYMGMADLYYAKSDVNNAISFYQSALGLLKKQGEDARLESEVKIKLGSSYATHLKQLDKGLALIMEGMQQAKQMHFKTAEEQAYLVLARAYYANGKYQQAFEAEDSYVKLHDSLITAYSNKEIKKIEELLELEKLKSQEDKEKIKILSDEVEAVEKNSYVILFGALSVILLILFSMVKKKKQRD